MTDTEYIEALKKSISTDGRSGMSVDRFWSKVDKNGPIPAHRPELGPCWVWVGSKVPKGYGRFGLYALYGKGPVTTSRISLELALERKLAAGMNACHKCDNPSCVNPEHLFEGTDKENIHDAQRKGRMPVKVITPKDPKRRVRLTPNQLQIIKEARTQKGLNIYEMGHMLGINYTLYFKFEKGERPAVDVEQLHFLLRFLEINESSFDIQQAQYFEWGTRGVKPGKPGAPQPYIRVFSDPLGKPVRPHVFWEKLSPSIEEYRADLIIDTLKSRAVPVTRMAEECGLPYRIFREVLTGKSRKAAYIQKVLNYAGLSQNQVLPNQLEKAA